MGSKRRHLPTQQDKKRIPVVADKHWDSDSSDEMHPLVQDSEIQFQDNPVLKDFFNLSNGGARLVQAQNQKKKDANLGTQTLSPTTKTDAAIPNSGVGFVHVNGKGFSALGG